MLKRKLKRQELEDAPAPYEDDVDDEGKPTGSTVFKFKTKAQLTTKDGKIIPNVLQSLIQKVLR